MKIKQPMTNPEVFFNSGFAFRRRHVQSTLLRQLKQKRWWHHLKEGLLKIQI